MNTSTSGTHTNVFNGKCSMPDQDPVLSESLHCLQAHLHPEWGDRTALDVVNRLLAKHVRPSDWTANTHLDIREEHISSRVEEWSVANLANITRAHGGLSRVESREPIILAEYSGAVRLLDGNHRINSWVAARDTRLHKVHIHTVSRLGSFVALPGRGRGA